MITKRIPFLVLLLLVIPLIYRCDLNEDNRNGETEFTNETEIQQAVTAIYANLQSSGLYQKTLWYAMDFMAIEQMNTADPVYHIFLEYNFDAGNEFIKDYWSRCYDGIHRANYVISNEESINNISDDLISP